MNPRLTLAGLVAFAVLWGIPRAHAGTIFVTSIGVDPTAESVPDASSTWVLLLLGLTATFGVKPVLLRKKS